MYEIHSVDLIDKKDLNIIRKKTKKTIIMLYDTRRKFNDFILQLKYRNNGKFEDIPHFIITKSGIIYRLFNEEFRSNTFNNDKIDRKLIKIAIENLGWLKKDTITNIFYNWIHTPYRQEPYTKQWRGYYYWDRYTEEQLNAINFICKHLCWRYSIPYEISSLEILEINPLKFKGIASKSNFQTIYTDINPSFDITKII
jgi:N-acetyl-anhydromuramyl-L-alanine amidase AmpD